MTGRLIGAAVILVAASVAVHAQPPLQGTSAPSPLPMTTRYLGIPSADAMLGKTVAGKDGQPVGIVEDLVLGPEGQVRQIVVAPGAASGTAPDLVAIDFRDVRMRSDSAELHVPDLDAAMVSALPAFGYADGVVSLKRRAPEASPHGSR